MLLVRARQQVPELRVVTRSTSTNSELLALAADAEVPSFTTLATWDQTAGRGRLDRTWVAAPGHALAVSVLVRGILASPSASWIPLLAGLAMVDALDEHWPGRFGLKWPNDVLLDERKVCGILAEAADARDVVVGAGLNLRQTEQELPVPSAVSLSSAGLVWDDDVIDAVLAGYLRRLRDDLESGIDAESARRRVSARCTTLGRRVRVDLPGERTLVGIASGIDGAGRLEVRGVDGAVVPVAVGDVIHARAV